jgi:hypothetical protein
MLDPDPDSDPQHCNKLRALCETEAASQLILDVALVSQELIVLDNLT